MRNQVLKFQLSMAVLAAAAATPAPTQRPAQALTPPDNAQLAASIDEHMRRLVPFGFSGVLLVVRDGQTVIRQGYGTAELETGRPFTPETPFYIGSLTKQFTAAGILRLEMEGRLRVTDSIGRFLPDVPEDKRGITLHHLLSNSAGLPGDPPAGVDADRDRDSVVREILAAPLRRPPGTQYAYSNAGFILLAAVVEIASGMPYEQYLREKLWAPVGMMRTGYRPPSVRQEEVAIGYGGGERWGNPMERHIFPDGPTWSLRGAGGMISTVDDMHAWSRALDGESVLSAEAKGKLWAKHVAENERGTSHYGYGWVVGTTSRGTNLVWHNGSNGIYYAELRRYVDEGVLVFTGSNVAEAMAEYALPGVTRITFGMPYTAPPAASSGDPARAAAAAGIYRLASGGTLTATAADGKLRVAAAGPDAFAALRGTMPSPALAAVGARAVAVFDAANRGDFVPLQRALGGERTLEQVSGMFQDFMAAEGLGAATAVEPVGTLGGGEEVTAVVRIRFERGELLLRTVWEGERLTGVEPMRPARETVFLPAPDGDWVSYDLQSAETVRLRIQGDALEIDTPAGPLRAARAP